MCISHVLGVYTHPKVSRKFYFSPKSENIPPKAPTELLANDFFKVVLYLTSGKSNFSETLPCLMKFRGYVPKTHLNFAIIFKTSKLILESGEYKTGQLLVMHSPVPLELNNDTPVLQGQKIMYQCCAHALFPSQYQILFCE